VPRIGREGVQQRIASVTVAHVGADVRQPSGFRRLSAVKAIGQPILFAIEERYNRRKLRARSHVLRVFLDPVLMQLGAWLQLHVAFQPVDRKLLDHAFYPSLSATSDICEASQRANWKKAPNALPA
jgi:hypothetical protein